MTQNMNSRDLHLIQLKSFKCKKQELKKPLVFQGKTKIFPNICHAKVTPALQPHYRYHHLLALQSATGQRAVTCLLVLRDLLAITGLLAILLLLAITSLVAIKTLLVITDLQGPTINNELTNNNGQRKLSINQKLCLIRNKLF